MNSPKKETPVVQEAVSATANSPVDFRRSEDFTELYANNIKFESSLWDLKLIFGQTDQSLGQNVVIQHTAVTIPWAQVKLMLFGLCITLAEQEGRAGRVQLARNLIGEIPEQMPKAVRDEGSISEETWKAVRKIYEDFITSNPEAAPVKNTK